MKSARLLLARLKPERKLTKVPERETVDQSLVIFAISGKVAATAQPCAKRSENASQKPPSKAPLGTSAVASAEMSA